MLTKETKRDPLEPLTIEELERLQDRPPDQALTPRDWVRLQKLHEMQQSDTLT